MMGELPFHSVYLHATVHDKENRKMSESLGNVIDPLEVFYGCTLDSLLYKLDDGNLPKKEVEKAKKDQADEFRRQHPPACHPVNQLQDQVLHPHLLLAPLQSHPSVVRTCHNWQSKDQLHKDDGHMSA